MAFGIGVNTQPADAGIIVRKQADIAVDCWFTSKGDTIPRIFKYQDEEGVIHIIDHIRILKKEEKRYCGIPVIEYQCEIEDNNYLVEIRLVFFLEEHRWVMLENSNV